MEEFVKVAVDAMGGDNAPEEIVKGAVEAVKESDKIQVILVGKEAVVKETLSHYDYPKDRISVVHAEDVITNEEAPVMAIRRKKNLLLL